MIGRTPSYIVAVRPLRQGAITDFDITQRMIRLLLQRVGVVPLQPAPGGDLRAVGHHRGRAPRRHARRRGGPARPRPTSSSSPWPRPSAPACPSTSRSATWSSTSAAAPPRRPSSPSAGWWRCEAVRVGSFDIDAAHPDLHPPRVRHRHRRAHGGGDQDHHRLGVADRERVRRRGAGPRAAHAGLPKTVVLSAEEVREAIDEPVSADRRRGHRLPRPGPARAGPGPHPAGHPPRRGRRACCAGLDLRLEHETESRCTWSTRRWSASCSAPATASRPTTTSRSCSWGDVEGGAGVVRTPFGESTVTELCTQAVERYDQSRWQWHACDAIHGD